jgi:hypothetical protein
MATLQLNYALPLSVTFTCNLPLNWEVERVRSAANNPSWTGSTAAPPVSKTATIPAGTFAVGDGLAWGADVFGPPTIASKYTLDVSVQQGGTTLATMSHMGSVAAAGSQIESGSWSCA